MKKVITLALAAALMLSLFAGCGNTASSSAASKAATSQAAVSSAATAKTAEIELEANATTGYQWKVKEAGENVKVTEGEYVVNSTASEMVGVGGKQYFTVEGVKEGSCEIVIEYVGPGTDAPVDETKTFTATVAADLSVTVK